MNLRTGSVDRELTVEIDDESVSGYLHGMDLELPELEVIACCICRFYKELAEEVGSVHLHALGQFAAEKGLQEEVELAGFAEMFDARVAEPYGFSFSFGQN